MARVERHPGSFGLQRPDRSVSMGQAWAEALLARTQQGNPGVGGRPDPQVPGWASNAVNSTLGGILGQGSLPETQRAAAEWAAQGLSLPTPGGAMRQEGTVNAIDTALNLVRPLALADVGVAGAAGSMMFPFPGLAPGAAPAVGAARKAGGGIAGALSGLLGRGADEAVSAAAPVVRETTEAAGSAGRQTFAEPVNGWRQLFGEGEKTVTKVVPAGKFDVALSRHTHPRASSVEGLSDYGNVTINFVPAAGASPLNLQDARASLREIREMAESLRNEGYNIWGQPARPELGRLYEEYGGMTRAYPDNPDSVLYALGRTPEAAGRVGRQSPAVDADRLAAAIQNTDGHDLFAYYKNLAQESGFESSEHWLKDEYMNYRIPNDSPQGWRKPHSLDEYLKSRVALGPGLNHIVYTQITEHAMRRMDELDDAARTASGAAPVVRETREYNPIQGTWTTSGPSSTSRI